jgi:hypothetical protein
MDKLAQKALVKAVIGNIPPEEIADTAANGKAVSFNYRGTISDNFMPEITVGHALVVVAYGSEAAIKRINQALDALAEHSTEL